MLPKPPVLPCMICPRLGSRVYYTPTSSGHPHSFCSSCPFSFARRSVGQIPKATFSACCLPAVWPPSLLHNCWPLLESLLYSQQGDVLAGLSSLFAWRAACLEHCPQHPTLRRFFTRQLQLNISFQMLARLSITNSPERQCW